MEEKKKADQFENRTELAVEAIERASRLFVTEFDIRYHQKKVVTKYSGQWVIRVMGKVFHNKDFIAAVKESLQFVMNANKKVNTKIKQLTP